MPRAVFHTAGVENAELDSRFFSHFGFMGFSLPVATSGLLLGAMLYNKVRDEAKQALGVSA